MSIDLYANCLTKVNRQIMLIITKNNYQINLRTGKRFVDLHIIITQLVWFVCGAYCRNHVFVKSLPDRSLKHVHFTEGFFLIRTYFTILGPANGLRNSLRLRVCYCGNNQRFVIPMPIHETTGAIARVMY